MGASAIGVTTTFGVIAVIYVGVCLAPLSGGRWRLMEKAAIDQDRVAA
ncbi:hypothetical protein [Frondihabitans sucicola]|nr:hypothetical protein [Frondihabitans sucicola]